MKHANNHPAFHPSDFTDDHYIGMNCYNRDTQTPVIVMMSKSCEPPHWLVVDGCERMYYLTRRDAIEYCRQKGYTKV